MLSDKFELEPLNMQDAPIRPAHESNRAPLDSVALERIMEEVRNATDCRPTAYNRMHNRHNR